MPNRWEIGYIAEEVDELGLKHLVQCNHAGQPDGLDYDKMVLYLAEIAKHQKAEIADMQQRLDDQQRRADDQHKQIDELKRILTDLTTNR